MNINQHDSSQYENVKGNLSSGKVKELSIESGNYDWLGDLSINDSITINFKDKSKISNGQGYSSLFNFQCQYDNNDNIKVEVNGYKDSDDKYGVKIYGFQRAIHADFLKSFTMNNFEFSDEDKRVFEALYISNVLNININEIKFSDGSNESQASGIRIDTYIDNIESISYNINISNCMFDR
ncbi:hypothetical protein ALNOE001_12350 [Candidatus Methanobinarius endosymbioticus]|uniref:Uncharacterized protein n=1 Tax=Candidatus Methanobinarius endosymbioticus TaxID=2006182 RepID=A0A366M9X9_9EURY|nr:hypothetical protein ALNOE001_12350 [Candidatus Methanobinarius endosymbioticus]